MQDTREKTKYFLTKYIHKYKTCTVNFIFKVLIQRGRRDKGGRVGVRETQRETKRDIEDTGKYRQSKQGERETDRQAKRERE